MSMGNRENDDDRMLTVEEVAAMLAVDKRTIHRLRSAEKFPEPCKIGRSARWWRSIVKGWADKGGTAGLSDQQ
jgi:predicted DNA-binding transcriptional regulator AlpA